MDGQTGKDIYKYAWMLPLFNGFQATGVVEPGHINLEK
jgi:hypothetical protein